MGKEGELSVTEEAIVDTPANIAGVVEEAVDDVEKKDKEAKKSKNGVWIHHIPGILQR